MTPQKSLFADPCSSLKPPTHPRCDPHCLVPQAREQCWRVTNSPGRCCSQGKLHPGWSGSTAWNAFAFFFFPLFLFICNKCRRGGDSEEVFARNPAQSQDHVWLPDRFILGPGRELPAAPLPKGVLGPQLLPQPLGGRHPQGPARSIASPFVADSEKLERRQKRTTKMMQGLEKMPCSRSPK